MGGEYVSQEQTFWNRVLELSKKRFKEQNFLTILSFASKTSQS